MTALIITLVTILRMSMNDNVRPVIEASGTSTSFSMMNRMLHLIAGFYNIQ
jgi:hypothetical protein